MYLLQTLVNPLDLFVRAPGEWLYFFMVIAICFACLLMMLGQRMRRPQDVVALRYTLALLGALTAWTTLMGGTLIALSLDQDAAKVLPPLERFASVMTITFLLWAFLSTGIRRYARLFHTFLGIIVLAVISAYVLSAAHWHNLAGTVDFNLSEWGVLWAFIAVSLSGVGVLLMLVYSKKITDAPLKLLFFVILLSGYGLTLIQAAQGNIIGDYSGPARLAFVGALIVLLALIYREIIASLAAEIAAKPRPTAREERATLHQTSVNDRDSSTLLAALESILEQSTEDDASKQIVRVIADMLNVDVCALLSSRDANYITVTVAYDDRNKTWMHNIPINLDNQPMLAATIEHPGRHSLMPNLNEHEIQDLLVRLNIDEIGPVYFQPLLDGGILAGILMLAMPYSKRRLRETEEGLIQRMGVILGDLLGLLQYGQEIHRTGESLYFLNTDVELPSHVSTQELQEGLRLAREQIIHLHGEIKHLKARLSEEENRVASELGVTDDGAPISQQMITLSDEQDQLRQERDTLSDQVQEAQAVLHGAFATDDTALINDIVASLQRERDALAVERDRLRIRLDEIVNQDSIVPESVQMVLDRMTEEKARLIDERDQLRIKLNEIQSQLETVGIKTSSTGLVQLVQQLTEHRMLLQEQNAGLKSEYQRLSDERVSLAKRIGDVDTQNKRVQALERDLENLATDREIAVQQRDQLQNELHEVYTKIDDIKEHRTRLLAQVSDYEEKLKETHAFQVKLRRELRVLADARSLWEGEKDRMRAEIQALRMERDQLLARTDGDRERLRELGDSGIGSLTMMVNDLTEQRQVLEHELYDIRETLSTAEYSLDLLRDQLHSEADMHLEHRVANSDLLVGLVHDLRTPMTSIIGYVDLLLAESAGILGDMQRRFLQRVAASIQRLTAMLNDLIRITELDAGTIALEPVSVNISSVIEDAITKAAVQFREKNLSVDLDFDTDIPLVRVDRDAIEQVIEQLLLNAYLVTPAESAISISISRRGHPLNSDNESVPCLYVAIKDRGGGIRPEDEARVFARKYKAVNPLISGLGDTGVGLAIAKALIEAQGGKLWMETQQGVGSSFVFVLPLNPITSPGD